MRSSPSICSFIAIEFFKQEPESCVLMAIKEATFSLDDHPPMRHSVTEQGGKDGNEPGN